MAKLTQRQIGLLRRTIASDCTTDEFEVFMDMVQARGLDPLMGHVVPKIAFGSDPARRRMSFIINRDGQRLIAQRCGDYRAATKPARYRTAGRKKHPANPDGIVSATVYLWKKDLASGQWFEVAGQAYWDEFSPLVETEEVVIAEASVASLSKRRSNGTDPTAPGADSWRRMPRLMLAKCAEMQALRAGWPDQFGGLYDEAEFHGVQTQFAETAADGGHDGRTIGSRPGRITIHWGETALPESVEMDAFGEKAMSYVSLHGPDQVRRWTQINREALRAFWHAQPTQALMLKRLIETKLGDGPQTLH